MQLMAVLPFDSAHCLPKVCQDLMSLEESPLRTQPDMYPNPADLKLDPNGQQRKWQWVVLLPWLDEKRLVDAFNELVVQELTASEKKRNTLGCVASASLLRAPLNCPVRCGALACALEENNELNCPAGAALTRRRPSRLRHLSPARALALHDRRRYEEMWFHEAHPVARLIAAEAAKAAERVDVKFAEHEWAPEEGVSGTFSLARTDAVPVESDLEMLCHRLDLASFKGPAGGKVAPQIFRAKWTMPYERPHLCAILPEASLAPPTLDARELARALGSHRPQLTMGELRAQRRRARADQERALHEYGRGGNARRLGGGAPQRDEGPGRKRPRIQHNDNRWTYSGRAAMGIGRERAPGQAAPNYVRPGQQQRAPWQDPGRAGPPPYQQQRQPPYQQQYQPPRQQGGGRAYSANAAAAAALRGAPPPQGYAPPPQQHVYSQGGYSGGYAPPPPQQQQQQHAVYNPAPPMGGGYGAPPPQHQAAPPPQYGAYNPAPPMGGYGAPPPQQQYAGYAPPPMHMPYPGQGQPPPAAQQPPPPAQPFSFQHP
jgi:hypothetical protein